MWLCTAERGSMLSSAQKRWLFQLCTNQTKPLDDVSAKERVDLFWCWCSHRLALLNPRFTRMWTVMSTAVCHRKFYSFLFPEYPCSALISYQEVLQIVAISTHWPLSFPVAWFRLCYLIGKHLKSTAGGGGRQAGREKLKCGPHFVLIYWNQYCDAFISTNFTGRQFRFYHVYTVILVYVSCLEIRFMCFQVVQIKRQHYLTS